MPDAAIDWSAITTKEKYKEYQEKYLWNRDVFTGFVFIHPVKDQFFQVNTPGYYDGFESEYIRRSGCLSDKRKEEAKLEMQTIKHGYHDTIVRKVDFKNETIIELFFSCISGIGFLIGVAVFIFRRGKMPAED